MTPETLRKLTETMLWHAEAVLAHAAAWEADLQARHTAEVAAEVYRNSDASLRARLLEVERAAKVVARVVRPGSHRLAVVIDEETTDDEKDALLELCRLMDPVLLPPSESGT